jgi:glutamine cyclotransferase
MQSKHWVRPALCVVLCAFAPAASVNSAAPTYGYEIVHVYPHDRNAFTQGLIYLNGFLYEGTGLNGRSSLRKVKLETGEVVQNIPLPQQYFGEGITDWGHDLIELTWQSGVGFVYDQFSFRKLRDFQYQGEGWGLTHDSANLIMSDGSAYLRYWDPRTFSEKRRLLVKDGDRPVTNLNELEYIKGEIYANIWMTDRIARISPKTGLVVGWINLEGLLTDADRVEPGAILNGIAYDSAHDRLFVTGKLWPKLFEIRLKPATKK